MFNIGFGEFVVIILVVLVVFGPEKMPQLARSLGRAIREFRKAYNTVTEDVMTEVKDVRGVTKDIKEALPDKKEISHHGQ